MKAILKLRKPKSDKLLGLYFENYDVIHCEYHFEKELKRNGELNSGVKGGNIQVTLPMIPTDALMSWVFDPMKKVNGEILIHDAHEEVLEKVSFDEGRCVNFRLHYEPGEKDMNVLLMLTINAQRMVIGEVEYTNRN